MVHSAGHCASAFTCEDEFAIMLYSHLAEEKNRRLSKVNLPVCGHTDWRCWVRIQAYSIKLHIKLSFTGRVHILHHYHYRPLPTSVSETVSGSGDLFLFLLVPGSDCREHWQLTQIVMAFKAKADCRTMPVLCLLPSKWWQEQ